MSSTKRFNRNFVIVGAVLIQLALGVIYAWSVFTPSLISDFGWNKLQTQLVFSVALASFALVMVLAGKLLPKVGPKKLVSGGALCLGFAYFFSGLFSLTNIYLVLFSLGIIAGAGIGLAYVVPIKVGISWFPDKKGLITGLGVAGFGFGATLWVKLAGSWGNLIENFGLSGTWMIYGIAFFLMLMIGKTWMVFPKDDGKSKIILSKTRSKTKKQTICLEPSVLKSINFYKLFFTFMFSASAGLMTIGLMKIFPKEALLLASTSLSEKQAIAIAGTAMAIFFSISNGLGRIFWGIIADKLGVKKSLVLMTALQALAIFLFQKLASYEYSLYLMSTIIGFNFGGNFSLFPTITASIFGQKDLAKNYSLVFLAYGLGGIFGPILGGKLGDMNNFALAFSICGILCLLASFIASSIDEKSGKATMLNLTK